MTTEATTENQEEAAEELIKSALENNTPEKLFVDGDATIEKILTRIETLSRGVPADLTTAKGRKLIASTAHKVARSKVYLDEIGKNLTAEFKAKTALVDQVRKKIRDRLDDLKAEIRRPLEAWEAAEAARVERQKAEVERLRLLVAGMTDAKTLDELDQVINEVRSSFLHNDGDDEAAETAVKFLSMANDYKPVAEARIRNAEAAAAERAKVQAELARQREAIEAERAELARLKAEIEAARAKPEPAPEIVCDKPESLAGIIDGIDKVIVGYTRANRDEPPAEVWDESEPEDNRTYPYTGGPANEPRLDPETGTPEVDHVGPKLPTKTFISPASPTMQAVMLKAELRKLAETAHDAYRATIRLADVSDGLKPYLVRLNDAVYRAYDVVGHKPAEIQAGALAEKGGDA